MRLRKKSILALGIILIISIPSIFFVMNILTPREPEPFDLDDAPQEMLNIQSRLQQKLNSGNFSWADIPDYVTFCQYVADNSPAVHDAVKGKNQVAALDVEDEGCIIYEIANDELDVRHSSTLPSEPDIIVSMSLDVFVSLVKMEQTAIAAFQNGDLGLEGSFSEALEVYNIFSTFNATLLGTSIDDSEGMIQFQITANRSESYDPGLTLFPCVEITITNGTRTMGTGHLFVVDESGKIIARLDNTLHNVHKFINSTTVLMGGQGGNLELWNYKTEVTETLPIPGGHHAFEYNPHTDTFMVLEYAYSEETWDGKPVLYDVISEYNRDGELIWQWDGRNHYPFNSTVHSSLGINETNRAGADWMHSNSFVWDKAEGVIYLNIRNQDTILKINRATKDIEWAAGRWGSFTVLAENGTSVDSLWAHSHSLESIGPNRFILFDNDFYNPSRLSTMHLDNASGYSGFVEFEIDEENEVIQETWSWRAENESYYFPASGGDADRLPNGNTIGLFGDTSLLLAEREPVIMTEVARTGEIAWELRVPGVNDTYYWVHRLERFYDKPKIQINSQSLDSPSGQVYANLTVWNAFKQDAASNGTLRVIADGSEVYEESFEFRRNWQSTPLVIDTNVGSFTSLKVTIENEDGLTVSRMLLGQEDAVPSPNWLLPIVLLSACIVLIPIVYYWKKESS